MVVPAKLTCATGQWLESPGVLVSVGVGWVGAVRNMEEVGLLSG